MQNCKTTNDSIRVQCERKISISFVRLTWSQTIDNMTCVLCPAHVQKSQNGL